MSVARGMKWGGILGKALELLDWGRGFLHGMIVLRGPQFSTLTGKVSASPTEGGMVRLGSMGMAGDAILPPLSLRDISPARRETGHRAHLAHYSPLEALPHCR